MTNPDNVGGLPTADQLYDIAADAWDQHQTNCRVTTTAGSLRKAVEAIHRELCRAAPAGGCDCGSAATSDPDQARHSADCATYSAPAGGDVERFSPDCEPCSDFESWVGCMRPDPNGQWVRYAPAGSGEVQWPPRAMRGDDYVMLDDGRETLPLMSGCKGCRADEAGTWNRCIDECQKAVAKASGAGPDAFRLARWMEIHFRGNFPTPEFREIHAALLRKLQQGADYVMVPRDAKIETLELMAVAYEHGETQFHDLIGPMGFAYAALVASQDQEGGK